MTWAQTARYTQGYNNTPMGFFNTQEGQAWKNQANPWTQQVNNLSGLTSGFNPSDPASSTGIYNYGSWKSPDINDPKTIADMGVYRNMMQGDQQAAMNSYVRRAATAGAQRGGMALGGVAPSEATGTLAAIRDIGGQTTQLNKDALSYLRQRNQDNYRLQQDQFANYLQAINAQNSAIGQQSAWDTNRMKTLYGAWNDTPGAIMKAASYSDTANQQAQQMKQQQAAQDQAAYGNQLWREATMGQQPTDAGFLPQSNYIMSYLMGAPTRR